MPGRLQTRNPALTRLHPVLAARTTVPAQERARRTIDEVIGRLSPLGSRAHHEYNRAWGQNGDYERSAKRIVNGHAWLLFFRVH